VALPSHTLTGVLSRIQRGEQGTDPDLARRLDLAFEKHEHQLRLHCRGELRGFPETVVEEVVQDVLLEAWIKLPAYQPREHFRAFLWRIASLKCANVRRKRRDLLTEDGLLEVGSEERTVIARLYEEERNALVDEAAKNVLDDVDQELVHMRWTLDLPLADIAEQLGLPDDNAARVRLQRCKRRMRKEIQRLLTERGLGESFLSDPS